MPSGNVGISGRTIAAISDDRMNGRAVIDASGLVVSPGFIDLHAHGQTPETYRFQARDGVTTALELEVGTGDIAAWYAARKSGALYQLRSQHRPHSCAHGGAARSRAHSFLPAMALIARHRRRKSRRS